MGSIQFSNELLSVSRVIQVITKKVNVLLILFTSGVQLYYPEYMQGGDVFLDSRHDFSWPPKYSTVKLRCKHD